MQRSGPQNPQRMTQVTPSREDDERGKAFWRSRASLRMWPVKGSAEIELRVAVLAFVRGPLDVQQEEVPDLQIESIRRTRVSPKSLVRDEVVVVFKDANTRGLLASKGRNLARYVGSNGKPEACLLYTSPSPRD